MPNMNHLTWVAPDTGGSPITGYLLYRGTTPGGESGTPIATLAANVTVHNDTSVTNGVTYYYTLVAVNAIGDSVASVEVSATPADVPEAPSLSVTPAAAKNTITWSAFSDGGSPMICLTLLRSTTSGGESSPETATAMAVPRSATAGGSYVDYDLTNGVTYYYTLVAANWIGTSTSAEASGMPSADAATVPSAPTVTATAV